MGGGPRTFPGGLSKWGYKRMHEKLARRKQQGLLRHEKQLYLARLRSEIRASRLPAADSSAQPAEGPTSSRAHIRALADRFRKPGAEDLWNEDDGPLRRNKQPPNSIPPGGRRQLLDSGKPRGGASWKDWDDLALELPQQAGAGGKEPTLAAFNPRREYRTATTWLSHCSSVSGTPSSQRKETLFGFLGQRRCYTVMSPCSASWQSRLALTPFGPGRLADGRVLPAMALLSQERLYAVAARKFGRKWRPDSSDEEGVSTSKRGLKFGKFGASSDEDSESDESGETSPIRRRWSSAALRNCDMKKERRVLKSYEEENNDLAGRIRELREEIKNREVLGTERRRYESRGESLLTNKRFDECGISPLTVKALTDAGYIQTTVVQEAALPVCLEGKDVLVKAKTGTGKSAAFLLPAIESVLNGMKKSTNHRISPIFALVLCPTRELAIQLTAEANVLLKYHEGLGVQSLIGGTRFKFDQRRLESDPCQILVATPGRLLDHIENKSSFSVRLMGLKLLVLDEADHLLDLGFRKDIEKIVDSLPRQRQTLLFSATVPKEVRRVSQLVLKRDHVFVDTVGLGAVETPTKVQQLYHVVPHELHFHMVHHLLQEHIDREVDYKVIVFCTSAMVTEFMYIMLRDLKLNVRQIHSRKPQLHRTRISEEFRDSNRLILVTSDVSTRGVNYPDVTLVIQVGAPPDREHYIHRLGRTGRGGKTGRGILLIAPWEEYFLNEIHDLPIEKDQAPEIDWEMKQKVDDSIKIVDMSIKEAAYHAWLGYYNSIADDWIVLSSMASILKHDQEDRLSKLPNDILINILDRLQIHDAARTSILSRRWQQLSTMISKVIMDIDDFLPEDCTEFTMDDLIQSNTSLIEATKHILGCRNGGQYTIHILCIKFYLRDDDSVSIGQIVANTMETQRAGTAEFTILTPKQNDQCAETDLLEYARQFKLFFDSCPNVFAGLTHLQLQNLRFGDTDVPNVLATCKRLAFLCLQNCDSGFRSKLHLEHQELNELEIVGSRFEMVVLECLPKLTKLTFNGWISYGHPFCFGYVPLLQTVRLTNTGLSWLKLLKISELLHNAPSLCNLHLNFKSEKIWVQPEGPKQLARVFHKLRFLNLVNVPEGCDLSWTMFILEGAPYLKELYVSVRDHFCEMMKDEKMRRALSYSEKKNVEWAEPPSDFKHQSLALLVIFGFDESEAYFVRYIRHVMETAVNLEDVFLYRKLACKKCKSKVAMTCKYPRTKKQQCSLRNRITKGTHSLAIVHFPPAIIHFPNARMQ
ncbi:hypothetical protein EJB05_19126 [Eragrostis curvula]|uniref:RNA helicase n=1 Tax=Eragrostis curvula TaxID=38414 RepID=A0A5J9UWG0_9POAL|nr:hypothetical protein EJB05_19126 [Eragrostis curvula]